MRPLSIPFILLFVACGVALSAEGAESPKFFPTNVTPDQVVQMTSSFRRKLLASYSTNTNLWAPRDLLPIAIAYALEGQHAQSERAYKSYLEVMPNDARANRGLGGVYLTQKKYSEAIDSLGNAWRLGDQKALPLLTTAHLAVKQLEKVRDFLPALIKLKREGKGSLRENAFQTLVAYAISVKPFDRKTFADAMEAVSDEEILANDGAPELVIEGLKLAGDEKRAAALKGQLECLKQPKSRDKLL